MAIEITDDGATILYNDTASTRKISFNKSTVSVSSNSDRNTIFLQDDRQIREFNFSDVTIPAGLADADAVRDAIEDMFDTGGIALSDLMLAIPRGQIEGVTGVTQFGRNADVDTATTPEDIWDAGGVWVPPTTDRIHDIVSDDGDDISGGAGARTLRVFGLDANFDLQQEDIIMNALVNVPTVNTYTRIFKLQVLTAGASETNEGIITATAQTDATVTAQINPLNGQTQMAIYTVPNGKKAYVTHAFCSFNRSAAGTEQATVELDAVINIDTATKARMKTAVFGLSVNGSSMKDLKNEPYIEILGKTDLIMRATDVSANNSDISAGFDLILVDD